jgi:tellurite resistance protein
VNEVASAASFIRLQGLPGLIGYVAMPLSPEQEWTLVACGLVAHADGILEVGEWDQVLWMIEDRIDAAEVEPWLAALADKAELSRRLLALPLPAQLFAETILERAWRMALADGHGSDEEARVHDELSERLGVPKAEAAQLRATWLARAKQTSELVVAFAALVANADGRADSGERAEFDDLLDRLPLEDGRRDALRELVDAPPPIEQLVGKLATLDPEARGVALVSLAPLVRATTAGDRERELFIQLCEKVAVARSDAERMLDR